MWFLVRYIFINKDFLINLLLNTFSEDSVTGMEGGLESALARVSAHFEELRGRLAGQESAAKVAVEAHARERLAALSSTRADLAQRLAQVFT